MVTVRYVVPTFKFPPSAPPPNPNGGAKDPAQDGDWKKSVSSKDDHTSSLENIGDEKMPTNLNNLGAWGKGTTAAEGEWHAGRFGEINSQSSGDWGSAYVMGSSDYLKVQGRVYGDSGYKDGTVTLSGGLQGRVELLGHHYQAGYTSPTLFNFGGHDMQLRGTVNGDAQIGVTGTIDGGIALGKNDDVHVGARGFAGASASLQGSESLGDMGSVKGEATAWVGVGAKADLDVGYKDGEISFSFGAGLAFGYGFDYDFGFSINVGAIGDAIYNEASDAVDAVGDAGKWVGNEAEDAADAIGDAASSVGDAICDVFDW